jgi:hypothetical protein
MKAKNIISCLTFVRLQKLKKGLGVFQYIKNILDGAFFEFLQQIIVAKLKNELFLRLDKNL